MAHVKHVEPSGISKWPFFDVIPEAKAAARHAPDGYRAVFDANGVATLKDAWNEPYICPLSHPLEDIVFSLFDFVCLCFVMFLHVATFGKWIKLGQIWALCTAAQRMQDAQASYNLLSSGKPSVEHGFTDCHSGLADSFSEEMEDWWCAALGSSWQADQGIGFPTLDLDISWCWGMAFTQICPNAMVDWEHYLL